MKHKRAGKSFGRQRAARLRLFEGLTSALLRHGTIVTTEPKAKELRRWFEPLVTRARMEETLANRRLLLSKLATQADYSRLRKVAELHKDRAGGYLRLTKVGRRGDDAKMTKVEIIDN